MIYLGFNNKQEIINNYIQQNNIQKIFILSPKKFYFNYDKEFIEWNQIIMYKTFYRLLQEINKNTLIIINECLRKQNRYDLTYNCIRHFLNQTNHQIIFQYLPIIEKFEDFFILFDFDTKTRWKGKKDKELLKEINIKKNIISIELNKIEIKTDNKIKQKYNEEKEKLINNIGLKEPDTIPRNLYLLSGKYKLNEINQDNLFCYNKNKWYVGRNNRFKIKNFQTFKEEKYKEKYIIFELCHNFIDFIDFLNLSKQTKFDILISDLKVDNWYFERYNNWIKELNNVYSIL